MTKRGVRITGESTRLEAVDFASEHRYLLSARRHEVSAKLLKEEGDVNGHKSELRAAVDSWIKRAENAHVTGEYCVSAYALQNAARCCCLLGGDIWRHEAMERYINAGEEWKLAIDSQQKRMDGNSSITDINQLLFCCNSAKWCFINSGHTARADELDGLMDKLRALKALRN